MEDVSRGGKKKLEMLKKEWSESCTSGRDFPWYLYNFEFRRMFYVEQSLLCMMLVRNLGGSKAANLLRNQLNFLWNLCPEDLDCTVGVLVNPFWKALMLAWTLGASFAWLDMDGKSTRYWRPIMSVGAVLFLIMGPFVRGLLCSTFLLLLKVLLPSL